MAEYYPQHCSNPNFSPAEHIKELKEEITATIKDAERTPSNKKLMRALKEKITNFLDGRVQRVATESAHSRGQLPTSADPIPEPSFQRVTKAPKVTTSTNPTAPRVLKTTKRTHRRKTRNNTPGAVPPIKPTACDSNLVQYNMPTPKAAPRRSPRITIAEVTPTQQPTFTPAPCSTRSPRTITQEALSIITTDVYSRMDEEAYISTSIMPPPAAAVGIYHFCAPVVHPVTGETIAKYKTLVNDPATREI